MGADAAPTPRQWQGHSHRALRAMPMQLRKGKQALRLKMRCCVFFFYCFFPAPQGAIWDATSYVAGGVGRAAPQIKIPTSKSLCASFPNIPSCFSKESFPLFQFEKGKATLKECNNGTRKMLRMPFISGSFQATQTGMRSGMITQRKGTPSLLRTAGPEPSLSSNVISSVSRLVMQSMM